MVLLFGVYMMLEDYEKVGFFVVLVECCLFYDIVVVDFDLVVIFGGMVLLVLQVEIFELVCWEGYEKIWLGGILLGGLLVFCYNVDMLGIVDGFCLFVFYLGSWLIINVIVWVGGLVNWQVMLEEFDDFEFCMWCWL